MTRQRLPIVKISHQCPSYWIVEKKTIKKEKKRRVFYKQQMFLVKSQNRERVSKETHFGMPLDSGEKRYAL